MAKQPKVVDGEVKNDPVPIDDEPDYDDLDTEDQKKPDVTKIAPEDDNGEP